MKIVKEFTVRDGDNDSKKIIHATLFTGEKDECIREMKTIFNIYERDETTVYIGHNEDFTMLTATYAQYPHGKKTLTLATWNVV